MKKCIEQAIYNSLCEFNKTNFITNYLNIGGYELAFRDIVLQELNKLIKNNYCDGILNIKNGDRILIEKEKSFSEIKENNRTDIYVETNIEKDILEFGHYSTGQGTNKNAINKPISDIYKWLNVGIDNIYTINVITHWVGNFPKSYPKSYQTTIAKRIHNLNEIKDAFYVIDNHLVRIIFKPYIDVEMHIFVKGPFNRTDWGLLKTNNNLINFNLDVLKKQI